MFHVKQRNACSECVQRNMPSSEPFYTTFHSVCDVVQDATNLFQHALPNPARRVFSMSIL